MFAKRQQVVTIARHKHLDARRDGARENQVVSRIGRDGFRRFIGGGHARAGEIREERLDFPHLLDVEAKLDPQDTLQLGQDRLGENKLDATSDRLLNNPARRPTGDKRRDEYVRVTERASTHARV